MPHTKKRSAAVSAIGCLAALTLLAGCGGEAISAGDAKSCQSICQRFTK